MKRIIFLLAAFLIAIVAVSCEKKEDNKEAGPTITPVITESDDVVQSDVGSDTTQSADVTLSDDTAVSDETEGHTLEGAWITEDLTHIFSFMPEENECVYIADSVNFTSGYTYEDEILHILYTNESFTIVELDKKTLVLADESGNEIDFTKLSLSKTLKDVTSEDITGKWKCRIEDNESDAYFEMTLTLKADSTATVKTDTSGRKATVKDLTWSISKGKLIIDNGSGSENSELTFNILSKVDEDTYIMAFEGMAVAVTKM